MLIPYYSAKINVVHYDDIIGWNVPITYTRPTITSGPLRWHVPDAYSVTENFRPVMDPAVFPYSAISFYPNNGHFDGAPYNYTIEYASPVEFGMAGQWTLSRLVQVQMVSWKEEAGKIASFVAQLEARKIEDTWQTRAFYLDPAAYEADVAAASYAEDRILNNASYSVLAAPRLTTGGDPDLTIASTPCLMQAKWDGLRYFYDIRNTIESVVAYYDPDPPDIELVTLENAPAGSCMRASKDMFAVGQYVQLNWEWPSYLHIPFKPESTPATPQLIYWEQGPDYLYHAQPFLYDWVSLAYLASLLTENDIHGHTWYVQSDVPAGTYNAGLSRIAVGYEGPWGYVPAPAELHDVIFANNGSPSTSGGFLLVQRPKPWKFDDIEFIGYAPYSYYLEQDVVLDYAKNPDARFDGLFFWHKVKIATVTRAWFSHVRNYRKQEETSYYPYKIASLEATSWQDSETGVVRTDLPAPDCSTMTPPEFSLSPGIIGTPEYPSFDWTDYDWPAIDITIPGGSFLLEDGSQAPIYPDFHGAYIYDTHLKKWGKMDLVHKAVFDYMAINTYKPGEQAFARFGIFGGVLDSEGKIYLFDDSPANSYIVYGKIGYYRQGMTSPEEVRVHMRNPCDFEIKVSSSIEGRLLEPSFAVSTEFAQAVRGIHYGGYAAKWHNITISGKYDISYLEFRGIKTGKR